MGVQVRNDKPAVFASVGVHAEVEISLAIDHRCSMAAIHFGAVGPELVLDFVDLDSLERLAAVAAEGVRQVRARTAAEAHPVAVPDRANPLEMVVGIAGPGGGVE